MMAHVSVQEPALSHDSSKGAMARELPSYSKCLVSRETVHMGTMSRVKQDLVSVRLPHLLLEKLQCQLD
jgi:hypothetical protein